MQTNPNDCTVQYLDFPPKGWSRGWYVTAPEYDEIIEGPFGDGQEAEVWLENYVKNYEPPDPPGWEGGFAENH